MNELIDALDIGNDFIRFFVNEKTGKIDCWTEEGGYLNEEIEDDEFIPDHYIPLPHRWDLNKHGIMEDFCCSIRNKKIQDNLLHAIRGKGAFGRFHTAIHCYNIENDWYQFLHEQLKEIAIKFCKENNLTYHYRRKPQKAIDWQDA